MYILTNAFQNLFRNKGRNIMIGAIIFVVIISTVVALMINNTASGVIEDYKNRFGSKVSLVSDMDKLRNEAQANANGGRVAIRRPDIAPETLISFGQSGFHSSIL